MLLHEEGSDPSGTAAWLHSRPLLARHHHIRLSYDKVWFRLVCLCQGSDTGLQQTCSINECKWAVHLVCAMLACTARRLGRSLLLRVLLLAQDMARLSRWMAGKAVGLVLSGGGSRGLAHLGVLHALDDAGIPVDVIGGTSQVCVWQQMQEQLAAK